MVNRILGTAKSAAETLINSALTPLAGTFDDPNQQALFRWLAAQEHARREDYDRYRKYYGGDHPTRLTDRLKRFLNAELRFRDNFMDVVVDTLAERLEVTAFATNEEGDTRPVAEWAWNTWQANRMDAVQGVVHTEAVMLGDGYVLVDWDDENKRPRFSHQLPETIIPHYNETTRMIDFASKKWVTSPIDSDEMTTRLNLYYPERIEKFILQGNKWEQHLDPGDGMVWPIPWLMKDGTPLGMPVVHFRNRPAGSDFGNSEIANAIHLQDLLNKTLIDVAIQNDNAGFGRAYTVNLPVDLSAIDMLPGAWTVFHSAEEGGNFEVGQIAADDVEGLLKSLEAFVQHIAGTTRTPQHLFQITGGDPSGEALKVAETGLVKKALNRQVGFGSSWEDAMAMAYRLEATFGTNPGALTERFEVGWADPETRNQDMFIASLEKKQNLGVPQAQLWREMGYDQEQIQQMQTDQDEEKARSSNLGSQILREFTAGGT